jgi:hypothetical protein
MALEERKGIVRIARYDDERTSGIHGIFFEDEYARWEQGYAITL